MLILHHTYCYGKGCVWHNFENSSTYRMMVPIEGKNIANMRQTKRTTTWNAETFQNLQESTREGSWLKKTAGHPVWLSRLHVIGKPKKYSIVVGNTTAVIRGHVLRSYKHKKCRLTLRGNCFTVHDFGASVRTQRNRHSARDFGVGLGGYERGWWLKTRLSAGSWT